MAKKIISRKEFIRFFMDNGMTYRQTAYIVTKLFAFMRDSIIAGNTIRIPRFCEIDINLHNRKLVNNVYGIKGTQIVTPKSYHLRIHELPIFYRALKDVSKRDFPEEWKQFKEDMRKLCKDNGIQQFTKGNFGLPTKKVQSGDDR
jgi:nucleoid DNA-binding protein